LVGGVHSGLRNLGVGSSAVLPHAFEHSFWSDAYGPLPVEVRAREAVLVLIQLENSLLQRLLRLQAAEAQLSRVVWQKRRRVGRRAVRQIELERTRLARELHTGVGQVLAAIRMQVELIQHHLPRPAEPVAQALLNLGTLAAAALDQVRSISRRFHPPEWQRLPLDVALRQLWAMSGVAEGFSGNIQLASLAHEPDPDIKTLLYRAAQEALSNIIRHARASRIDLNLEDRDNRLVLSIQDNGVGFDTARVFGGPPDVASGIGLRAIREQANGLGGKLLVRSGPLGTTLEVSVPLAV
jgi:two-component system NarL family sensor kinase